MTFSAAAAVSFSYSCARKGVSLPIKRILNLWVLNCACSPLLPDSVMVQTHWAHFFVSQTVLSPSQNLVMTIGCAGPSSAASARDYNFLMEYPWCNSIIATTCLDLYVDLRILCINCCILTVDTCLDFFESMSLVNHFQEVMQYMGYIHMSCP